MFQNQIFWTQILDIIGDALILNGKCENDGAENENATCMIPERFVSIKIRRQVQISIFKRYFLQNSQLYPRFYRKLVKSDSHTITRLLTLNLGNLYNL